MANSTTVARAFAPAPISMAELFKAAFDGKNLKPLRAHMLGWVDANPSDAAALMNLCVIEQLIGDQASALQHQQRALALHRLYQSSWATSPRALRLLAFMAPGDIGTNTPLDFLLKDSDVALYSLYVIPGQPLPENLPDHDVAIVAVSESDANRLVLWEIERLIANWPRPVLNRPDRVLRLAREEMFVHLRTVPNLVMPPTVRVSRSSFAALGQASAPLTDFGRELKFPLIARPVDSHAGKGLAKLDATSAIEPYLAANPNLEFFISPFVEYRSGDGLYRKYRIIWVDGKAYPCHMAVADDWKLWYYNAGMSTNPTKREEESRFMAAFDDQFGRCHARPLRAIAETFGLEYMGIDCGETRDGRLLVFEGGIELVAHNMDSPGIYPYKGPAMLKLFAGFQQMLQGKAAAKAVSA